MQAEISPELLEELRRRAREQGRPKRELLDGAVKSYLERLSSLQRECRTLVAGDRGRRYPAQRSATSKDCAAAPTGPITGSWMVVRERPTPLGWAAAQDSRPTHSPPG
jgi:hypothetical protein